MPVRILSVTEQGKRELEGDLKAFGYGTPVFIEYEAGDENKRAVLETMSPSSFGHEHFSDRAQTVLWEHSVFNSLPRHVRSLDSGAFLRSGELISTGNAEEFFLLTEFAQGDGYFRDLDRLRKSGSATETDLKPLGCGIAVQAIAEHFPSTWVVPGLNTSFLGLPAEQGVWVERCAACGHCILGLTGGICPIAHCSKSLLNGPCGGSEAGHCEINPDVDCAWQLIYERLTSMNKLDVLLEIQPPKNWKTARDGGPRKITREDLRLAGEEE